MGRVVGIDPGPSHSVVGFSPAGERLAGTTATRQDDAHPKRTVSTVKKHTRSRCFDREER
jgi:molecular chaperone DnaK (HSP70)